MGEQENAKALVAMRTWLREESYANRVLATDTREGAAMRLQASMRADWSAEALYHLDRVAGQLNGKSQREHYEELLTELQARQQAEEGSA